MNYKIEFSNKAYKYYKKIDSVIYVCYIQLRTMFLLSLYLKLVLVGMFIVFSKSHLHRKWLFLGSGRAGA